MNIPQRNGHVMISSGKPVYSRREYIVRRFERNPYDGFETSSPFPPYQPARGSATIEPAIIFEDKETGLLTADVAKFEAWLYAGEKEEDR